MSFQQNLDGDTELCVIMPAYNEEDGIQLAVQEVIDEVLDLVPNSQLIVVNDGSKDSTGTILNELAGKDKRIVVINKTNSGHGPSVVQGLNQANSKYVMLIDSDMQIPLRCFPDLWALTKTYDAVFGIRQQRDDPKFRLILSVFINQMVRVTFGVDLVDSNIPCKVLKTEIWRKLYSVIPDPGMLAPSIVLAIYAKKNNYKVIDTPVPHRARERGQSTLKLKPLMIFCYRGFTQLLSYQSKLK
jgi:dolichol-phosphate mannosyltransferase